MPHGVGAHFFAKTESTNKLARKMAIAGSKGPIWLVAGTQSAGRGRQGRVWTSEPGNLYCSLLFAPHLKLADVAPLPFITSLAVRDTFLALGAEPTSAKCKWPNDVLINNKKASGILIESSASGAGTLDYLIIGIGMNLAHYPEDAMFPATSLAATTGEAATVRSALGILAEKLKNRLDAWQVGNFAPIRQEWLRYAWGLGETRKIQTADESFLATLVDLNEQGAVNVILDNGTKKTIYVADIFPSLKN